MRPPETAEGRSGSAEEAFRGSHWQWPRPGQRPLLFAALVASGWAIFLVLLTSAVRLFGPEEDAPSWGELLVASAFNAAVLFVVAFAISLVVRFVHRKRGSVPEGREAPDSSQPSPFDMTSADPLEIPPPQQKAWETWTIRGHRVVPTTTEGRIALLLSFLLPVPFVAVGAMLAAPVLLVLAWRKGDRGLLLALPVLVALFLVFFVTAEIFIGHD